MGANPQLINDTDAKQNFLQWIGEDGKVHIRSYGSYRNAGIVQPGAAWIAVEQIQKGNYVDASKG